MVRKPPAVTRYSAGPWGTSNPWISDTRRPRPGSPHARHKITAAARYSVISQEALPPSGSSVTGSKAARR